MSYIVTPPVIQTGPLITKTNTLCENKQRYYRLGDLELYD